MFKRILLLLCLFIGLSIAAEATTIHIQSQTISNWQDRRTSATSPPRLRGFASASFFTSDGKFIPAGQMNNPNSAFISITCSQSGTTVTIPAFDIDSTTDASSLTKAATYSFYWFSASGALLSTSPYLQNLYVQPNIVSTSGCVPIGTCATWNDLVLGSTPTPALPPDIFVTQPQMAAAIAAAAIGIRDPGSNGLLSRTALNNVIARSIAVGSNLSVLNADGVAGNPTINLGANVVTADQANTFTSSNIFQNIGLMGTAPSSAKYLNLVKTGISLTASSVYGINIDVSGGAGTDKTIAGVQSNATYTSSAVTHGQAIGVLGNATVNSGVTIDLASGFSANAFTSGTANQTIGISAAVGGIGAGSSLSEAYGIYSNTVSAASSSIGQAFGGLFKIQQASSGTITTAKGIAIDNWMGAATTSYALYIGSSVDIGATRNAIYSLSTSPSLLSGGLTINPPAGSTRAIETNQTVSGSIGINYGANRFLVTDTADVGGNFLAGFTIGHTFGGSTVKGGRNGLDVELTLNGATNSANANHNYTGGVFFVQATTGDGGGAGTEKGALFALNPQVIANAGASHLFGINGGEVDIAAVAGSSVASKSCWSLVGLDIDAVQGSVVDAMLILANQTGAVGWKNGILIGGVQPPLVNPIHSTGSIIATTGPGTVTNGLDFASYTFTGNAIHTPGFMVRGDGVIGVQTTTIDAWQSLFFPVYIGRDQTIAGQNGSNPSLAISQNAYFDGATAKWKYISSGATDAGAANLIINQGSFLFRTAVSGNAGTDINGTGIWTNALFMDQTGKVGVGTTAPSTLLHVGLAGTLKGTLGLAGNTSGLVTVQPAAAAGTWSWTIPTSGGTADFALTTDGTGISSWVTGQSIAGLKTSSTPQFTRLGIGNPADATDSFFVLTTNTYPNSGIKLQGAVTNLALRLINTNSGGRDWYVLSSDGSATVAGGFRVFDSTASADRLTINNSGITSLFKGADVASAATITPTGNVFHVTGTTTITSVSGTGIVAGTTIQIIFDGVLTFTDGSNLKLAGNFVTTADDTITLAYDGSNWFEVARSVN